MRERLFTAIDVATLAYVGLATVAVLLPLQGEDIPGWPWLLAALSGLETSSATGARWADVWTVSAMDPALDDDQATR